MRLFDDDPPSPPASSAAGEPLAARVRPRSFDEFVGQEHLVRPDGVLRRALDGGGHLFSFILWGPPGTGKTTLANLVARATRAHLIALSAVTAGVAELRQAAEEARRLQRMGRRTVLFVDEVHRFNRAQQDAVLPHVESGLLTFIGATTENPSFAIVGALLSRCRVFQLYPLTEEQVAEVVRRALADAERGLGGQGVDLTPEAMEALVGLADGDARAALNALELAAAATPADERGRRVVNRDTVVEAYQRRTLRYDQSGDQHYDLISAFIKSVRGSDPDAAVYWLARMLEAGEDPLFIARRLVILAAEDVGLADPQGLVVAVAAQQAVHFVGMPEGYLPLAEATLYLATAPKSNSALTAYVAAREEIQRTGSLPVPLHLRNAPTDLMRSLGYGQGYRYAHDYPGHVVEQAHLPEAILGRRFYQPGSLGYEGTLRRDAPSAELPDREAGSTGPDRAD
ncbi:MAG TPA: replication-associated recombination protein A [Chloroflexota bacterium]